MTLYALYVETIIWNLSQNTIKPYYSTVFKKYTWKQVYFLFLWIFIKQKLNKFD
jgi:hypothetical protein